MSALSYPPHITLAVYEDIDRLLLFEVFDQVFDPFESTPMRFNSVGYFESSEALIVFASPVLSDAVTRAHKLIHRLIGPARSRSRYPAGSWIPHCSLATSVPYFQKGRLLELLTEPLEPFTLTFDAADCVSAMPITVLRQMHFSNS